jgi:hypothetical protein
MEIKIAPVTYSDRIEYLSNKSAVQEVKNTSIQWGIIFSIIGVGIITTIIINDYYRKKYPDKIRDGQ